VSVCATSSLPGTRVQKKFLHECQLQQAGVVPVSYCRQPDSMPLLLRPLASSSSSSISDLCYTWRSPYACIVYYSLGLLRFINSHSSHLTSVTPGDHHSFALFNTNISCCLGSANQTVIPFSMLMGVIILYISDKGLYLQLSSMLGAAVVILG